MTRPLILCLFFLLTANHAPAQESAELPENVVQLRQMASQARAAGDTERFRTIVARLHELRPNNTDYMYRLVLAHAVLNEKEEAFNLMLAMQRQGLSYDFNQSPDSMNLRNTSLYEYLNDLMIKAGSPLGAYETVASLDPAAGRVKAIDWDPGRERFLVGTVTEGRLLAVGRDGSLDELLRADTENGLWGIHDLVVDGERNRLWMVSSATRAFSGYDETDRGRSALFEFTLDSMELVKRYPVPVDGLPHSLGSIALTGAGDLYMADHTLPIIYRFEQGAGRLEAMFASRGLVALRGIAAPPGGEVLYLADYEMGIIRLDPETGEARFLMREETLNLGGIDGIEYVDGDLLILQNGIRPQRIMRLTLDTAGERVTAVAPVIVAPQDLDRPSSGTVVGNRLVFLATAAGKEDSAAQQTVRLVETDIQGLQNIVPPDMQRFLEQQARQRMAPPESMRAPDSESGVQEEAEDPDEG